MELLLNLTWLLLALPAYWLWRASRTAHKSELQRLLSLGFLLVILFPVISATDDLQAMRAEMEESPAASKRTLRQVHSENGLLSAGQTPAVISGIFSSFVSKEEWHQVSTSPLVLSPIPPTRSFGRAPPSTVR